MNFLMLMISGVVGVLAEERVLTEFAEGNNQFIGDLYKQLVKKHPDNFVVCPLSVQSVLSLLSEGANGNTAKQIITSLHLPEVESKRASTFYSLGRTLRTNNKYTLGSANKIYVAKGFKIRDSYERLAIDVYQSEIQNIDFGQTQEAVAEVNKWVEQKTHDQIKNLLNAEVVGPQTLAVLVNALYFQGKWLKQFDLITNMPFYFNDHAVLMNMMKVVHKFNYYESPELKAKFLELPYEGDEMSLTIVLPNDAEGLSGLETRISDVLVAPKYEKHRVNVYIPKFKIDTTTPLIPILQNLGITDAFTSAADFSGIIQNQEHLVISEVVQKAFIEVDEKGTIAAAATAVIVNRMGGADYDFTFVANHPFMFYLKHRVNGVIFIGRYSTPGPNESEPWPYAKEQ